MGNYLFFFSNIISNVFKARPCATYVFTIKAVFQIYLRDLFLLFLETFLLGSFESHLGFILASKKTL